MTASSGVFTGTGCTAEHRADIANASLWWVSPAGGHWSVEVATCEDDARGLGLLRLAAVTGRRGVDLLLPVAVRAATDDDIERWTQILDLSGGR